jgi:HEAT repeat protein
MQPDAPAGFATCPRIEAAHSLGAIHDPRTVEPLIAALGEGDLLCRQAMAAALKAITGHDFGEDAVRWGEWAKQHQN